MSFQEERMLKMIEQLPQNDSEVGYNAVIPVVEWEFSDTGDPVKDRRRNIKNALKALKPEKRWFAIPGFGLLPFVGGARFRYSGNANRCVVTGSDCTALSYGELWDMYRPDLFTPYSKVLPGAGIPLNGTYSPQHMQLYHLLLQWVEQEAAENDKGFFKRMKKKGVSFIPIRREEVVQTDPLLNKWSEAFMEAEKDGIPIMHFKNPGCPNCGYGKGQNDVTFMMFDNRTLNATFERADTMDGKAYETTSKGAQVN